MLSEMVSQPTQWKAPVTERHPDNNGAEGARSSRNNAGTISKELTTPAMILTWCTHPASDMYCVRVAQAFLYRLDFCDGSG